MYIIQFVLKCLIGLWKGKLLAFGKAYVTMFVLVITFLGLQFQFYQNQYTYFCINNKQKVSQLQHNGMKVTHYGDGDKISPRNIILEFPIRNASTVHSVQSPMIHQICQLMTLNRFNYTITKYHYETVWKKYLPIKNFIVILFSSSVRKFCSLHVVVMSRWD